MKHEERQSEKITEGRVFTGRKKSSTGRKGLTPSEKSEWSENTLEHKTEAEEKESGFSTTQKNSQVKSQKAKKASARDRFAFKSIAETEQIPVTSIPKNKLKKGNQTTHPVRTLKEIQDIANDFAEDQAEDEQKNNVSEDVLRSGERILERFYTDTPKNRQKGNFQVPETDSLKQKNSYGERIVKEKTAEPDTSYKQKLNRKRYRKNRRYKARQRENIQQFIKAKKKKEILKAVRTKSVLGFFLLVLLVLIMLILFLGSANFMLNAFSTTMASTYLSKPVEIDQTELYFTELEMELKEEIDGIETEYPDYDEYEYNLGEIGHDPGVLISYLSAQYLEFSAEEMKPIIQQLFDEMYQLTTEPYLEVRERVITEIDEATGEEIEVIESYEVRILRVTLTVTPLQDLLMQKMDPDNKALFDAYQTTKGALQIFGIPVDYYWYHYVSAYYGYRKNPVTEEIEFHRGIDIAVPEGTEVYATHHGVVQTASYDERYGNYVVISNAEGYTTKYGHLSNVLVTTGEQVRKGTVIGKTGATGVITGSHLHLECLYQGAYYNPYFYFNAGTETMYGEHTGGSGATDLVIPNGYDDRQVEKLIKEGEKYLGMPFVWGGNSPTTGFDCSGFVSYVYRNSGTYPLERTTAMGIYEKCAPVSMQEAKAGDLIFFTGTYHTVVPVTHVGIYCGNGIMLHCGDPIKYASIHTPYWQNHFYAFGRLQ